MFTIDGKPEKSKFICPTCGKKHTRVVGFVLKDGAAYAAYHAYFYDGHTEDEAPASFLIIFADWANDTERLVNAVGFNAVVNRDTGEDVQFSLQDPTHNDIDILVLSREAALKHERVQDMWEVLDFIMWADPTAHKQWFGHAPRFESGKGFLKRLFRM